jgi:enoyl-CoA hydratase/carnithine racemase
MGVGISTSRRGAILAIAFDREEKKNALTAAMYDAMAKAIAAAEAEDDVRVILFHGSPRVFTAGNDIEDFVQRPPTTEDAPVFRFIRSVIDCTRPLVAAVNGPAVGLGTTLLLHCDLVYAGDDARFCMPFTQLGVVPEFASSYLLPLIAGYQRAAELLLLGEPFDAQAALAAGFVTRVVPAAQAQEAAWAAAEKLARLPRNSIRLTRSLLRSAHHDAILRQAQLEGGHFGKLLAEPAAREALTAFLEKRRPDFSGK